MAGLRFEYGVPHYRLAKIQGHKGLALLPANQDRMVKQVAVSAAPIYEKLIAEAWLLVTTCHVPSFFCEPILVETIVSRFVNSRRLQVNGILAEKEWKPRICLFLGQGRDETKNLAAR